MSLLHPRPLLPITLALLALLSGCDRRQAGDHPAPASRSDAASDDLAAIQADPDELSRLRRLALWVEQHAPAEIARAALQSPPHHQGELVWLLQLKLADLNPGADDEALGRLASELLYKDNAAGNSAPAGLREELLTLAKTSPGAALERIKTTRIHPNKRSEIANAILAQVAGESPERAFALLAASPGDRRDGLNAIAHAWTSKDPRAALEWAHALPPSDYNRGLIDEMIETWSGQDPGAAAEYISGLPVTRANRHLFSEVIGNWMRESPDESAKWIQAHGISDPVVVKAALMTLGATHPALVARLLQGPLTASERRYYGERLVSAWMRSDPSAARAWLDALPPSPASLEIMKTYASSLAYQNIDGAIAYYQSLPGDLYTGAIAADIGRQLSPKSKALDWLLAQPDSQDVRSAIRDVIGGMNFAQPADMLAMLGQIPSGPRQISVYQAAAARWFSEDPASAARWASGLKDIQVLKAVIRDNADAWTATQPDGLAAVFAGLPASDAAGRELSAFVEKWSARDPAAAADWFVQNSSLPLPDYRVRELFGQLAEHSPATLGAKLSSLPEGKVRETALRGAIGQLAKTAPQTAVEMLTRHATPKERESVAGILAGTWAKADPDAAIAWTGTLPASAARDNGVRQIIYELGSSNPQRGLALAGMASTPAAKENLTADAIHAWHNHDAQAALAALETAPLSPERREKLRATLLRR